MRREKMRTFITVASMVALGMVLLAGSVSPTSAQTLQRIQFEDGTGSIGLPPGWQINNSYRGSVTCVGPNGGMVVLGMPWTIVDAADPAIISLPSVRQQPIANVGDIVSGWREVMLKRFGARLLGVRGNRTTGFARGVPAYHLLYEIQQNGVRYTGMGYFTVLYTQGSPGWQIYSSYVISSSETFPQMVQTMVSMWRTWRPNGQEPREGSTSAMWDRILQERRLSFEFWQREFREQL